jgi:hypothetical protein
VVHPAGRGQARAARSQDRQVGPAGARAGCGAAWRDRRPRRRALGHRRRTERDRARRPADPRGEGFPAAEGARQRQPQHRELRSRGHALVHGAERRLRPARSEDGRHDGVRRAARRQGARRVWTDSKGALWITGWESGDLFRYDSKAKSWARWHLPGEHPQPYAVYVDEADAVWLSDWGSNAILRFDPKSERFESYPLPDRYGGVRQLAGRKGEVWGAESGADKLFVLRAE